MKSILFATTALVATAGIAAADVTLTGSAEMGIFGGDDIADQFHTDIDVTFGMSGEADNGLSFGASVDLDESIGDNNADDGGAESGATRNDADDGGATMFVAYGGAKLTMGDTDGAFDAAMKEAIIGGSIRDDNEHAGYNGGDEVDGLYDGQIARFDYSYDAFTGSISVEIDDSGDLDPIWGLGVRYVGELAGLDIGVGVAYQGGEFNDGGTATDIDAWGISLDTTFANGIVAIANYSEYDLEGSDIVTHTGLAFGYSLNALTVAVNWGEFEDGSDSASGWSLIADYDLGGGIEAQFGYGSNDVEIGGVDDDYDTYSLGLAMSF